MQFKKLKYSLIENIVLNVLIFYIFFQLNPLKDNFLTMNIHPLLIVVIGMSLRYGNYIGLISACFASIIYITAYSLLGRDLYLFFIDFQHYKFILMFLLSAVIFGRFKDNYDFEIDNMKLNYELLDNKYEDLMDGYKKERFIKEELRKQIIGAEYSIVSLYEIASSLETLDSEDIYTEVMHLLSKFLKAKTISIYIVNNEEKYLRLKLKKGKDKIVPNSMTIEDCNCYKRAIELKKPVKIDINCKDKDKCPLMVGPIVKNARVIAFINIESMDFERVTDYSYNLFKVIVDWINKALVQALEVEKKLSEDKFFYNTNIMKYKYLRERLEEEEERRVRYDLAFAYIQFRNKDYTVEELEGLLNITIRNVDVAAYDKDTNKLYILLPATNLESSNLVINRILDKSQNKLELIGNE